MERSLGTARNSIVKKCSPNLGLYEDKADLGIRSLWSVMGLAYSAALVTRASQIKAVECLQEVVH